MQRGTYISTYFWDLLKHNLWDLCHCHLFFIGCFQFVTSQNWFHWKQTKLKKNITESAVKPYKSLIYYTGYSSLEYFFISAVQNSNFFLYKTWFGGIFACCQYTHITGVTWYMLCIYCYCKLQTESNAALFFFTFEATIF